MQDTWLLLMPPLLVLISASITRRLNSSLFLGIASAGLIATDGSIKSCALLIGNHFYTHLTNTNNLYLYVFLFAIGTLIALFNFTGCAITFAQLVTTKLKTSRAVQTSSLALSSLLFIDDYLSILTTGYVMSSLTDQFRIPRLKLAFLVHSLSGALVILFPISSWVATINSYLGQAGVDSPATTTTTILADPFFIYLRSIPFFFYSFLMIASTWFIVRRSISYGPLAVYEKDIVNTPLPSTNKPYIPRIKGINHPILDLLIPLISLIGIVLIGIPYSGGFWLFGGTRTLLESFKYNQDTFFIMAIASVSALIIATALAFNRKSVHHSHLTKIAQHGITLMLSAAIMVFLSANLGVMLKDDLKTGYYLASILLGSVPLPLLPALFFIVSLLCAMVTGGAWATFGLMISIAVPMLISLLQATVPADPHSIPLLFPILGAIFSGAVCGDHVSPVSETTAMAATSTQVNPIEHAYTQIFYALPAICCSLIGFLIAGYLVGYPLWIAVGVPLISSMIICLSVLTILSKRSRRKK